MATHHTAEALFVLLKYRHGVGEASLLEAKARDAGASQHERALARRMGTLMKGTWPGSERTAGAARVAALPTAGEGRPSAIRGHGWTLMLPTPMPLLPPLPRQWWVRRVWEVGGGRETGMVLLRWVSMMHVGEGDDGKDRMMQRQGRTRLEFTSRVAIPSCAFSACALAGLGPSSLDVFTPGPVSAALASSARPAGAPRHEPFHLLGRLNVLKRGPCIHDGATKAI